MVSCKDCVNFDSEVESVTVPCVEKQLDKEAIGNPERTTAYSKPCKMFKEIRFGSFW